MIGLIFFGIVVALLVLSLRAGADSRDGDDWANHSRV